MASGSSRFTFRLRWLLTALPLVMLTGCFDVLEELWINPDGSARVVLDLALPKSLADLSGLGGGKDVMEEVREKRAAAEAEARKDPNVTELVFRDYEEGDRVHIVYELSVKDATALPELYRKVQAETADEEQPASGAWDFSLEREGGDYVFLRRFVPDKAAPGSAADTGDSTEAAAREIAKGVAKALLVNNHVTFRVHGPGILDTNGKVNEKKDTVEWKLSLAELVDAPTEGLELRAVVYGGEPLWLWPLVLGVPLAVLGLAIATARRKRAVYGRG